ncbi:peptidoglycan-binding protein [Oleisolibacter albus]|uniref:peptidoglycan-binding protein n=1 Tax=Oleisolibacter albus TaxID=2171757 RepID=UPI0012D83B0C|nr:peptidoglycan-binding protein [Oleisolibacter albus]
MRRSCRLFAPFLLATMLAAPPASAATAKQPDATASHETTAAGKKPAVKTPVVKPVAKPAVKPVAAARSMAKPAAKPQKAGAPAQTPAKATPAAKSGPFAGKAAGRPSKGGKAMAAAAGAAALTAPPPLPAKADEPLRLLDSRARAGDVDAQVELAEYFASGTPPTAADVRKAVYWYEQAATQGDADAGWALAALYRGDLGVPADLDKAVGWYRRAAELGHAEAMYDLGLLYSDGTGVDRDLEQAASWFEQAADAGIARALIMLGALYEEGVDGAPDLDTAAGWYARAAESGDSTARAALQRLAEGGSNIEIAEAGPLDAAAPAASRPPATAASHGNHAIPVDQAGVKEIQERLKRLGYKIGTPDGFLGKRTVAAIRAYQKKQGLPADGRASHDLLVSLRGSRVG